MIYLATQAIQSDNNSDRGMRNLAPMWNFKTNDSVRISAFTNCSEAELFLNGQSLGRKVLAHNDDRILSWKTVYEPGLLVVKGSNNGTVVTADTLQTTTKPASIVTHVYKSKLPNNLLQMHQVEINIVDQHGQIVYAADDEVNITITGNARLVGMESGSYDSHESYQANHHKVLHGKLLAFIQPLNDEGVAKISISYPGLPTKNLALPNK